MSGGFIGIDRVSVSDYWSLESLCQFDTIHGEHANTCVYMRYEHRGSLVSEGGNIAISVVLGLDDGLQWAVAEVALAIELRGIGRRLLRGEEEALASEGNAFCLALFCCACNTHKVMNMDGTSPARLKACTHRDSR